VAAAHRHRASPWWPTDEQTETALQILAAIPAPVHWLPMTWTRGGCLVAARALQRWGGGDLMAMQLPLPNGDVYVEHVVVRIGEDRYLDANGVHTGQELKVQMEAAEAGSQGQWVIVPCAVRQAQKQIFDSRQWVARLTSRLEQVVAPARDLTAATANLA
jgi:hypothetical protein